MTANQPHCSKRAESDDTVPDAPARAEKFAQRYQLHPNHTLISQPPLFPPSPNIDFLVILQIPMLYWIDSIF